MYLCVCMCVLLVPKRIRNYFSIQVAAGALRGSWELFLLTANCLEEPACCSDCTDNSGQIKKWPGEKKWSQHHMISLVFPVP